MYLLFTESVWSQYQLKYDYWIRHVLLQICLKRNDWSLLLVFWGVHNFLFLLYWDNSENL